MHRINDKVNSNKLKHEPYILFDSYEKGLCRIWSDGIQKNVYTDTMNVAMRFVGTFIPHGPKRL